MQLHQQAWLHLGCLDAGFATSYAAKRKGNGVYAFVLEGRVTVNGQILGRYGGLESRDIDAPHLKANQQTDILLLDVPTHA